jgi:hypothetical protein
MDVKRNSIGGGVQLINLPENKDMWQVLANKNKPLGCTKCGEFPDYLRKY